MIKVQFVKEEVIIRQYFKKNQITVKNTNNIYPIQYNCIPKRFICQIKRYIIISIYNNQYIKAMNVFYYPYLM